MKRFLFLFILLMMFSILFSGCFSVMRIPLPVYKTVVDPITLEPKSVVDHYENCPNYPMCIYPTLHLRGHMFAFAWNSKMQVGQRIAGPIGGLISIIGLPGDLIVDTIALPWDWNASEKASCPMCTGRGCWNDAVPEDAPVDGVIIRCNGTRVK